MEAVVVFFPASSPEAGAILAGMSRRNPAPTSRPFPTAIVCGALVAAVWAVFGQVANHGFINFDDDAYVSRNAMVSAGLTWAGIRWAVTNVSYFYWQPITWLSHLWDVEVFGLNPAGHHLVNVAIHAVNTLLLFAIVRRMTGAARRAAAVAGVWAIHPLRVESVAWVAERKDVLGGFFALLTLLAYVRYAQRPGSGRYAAVVGLFLCALASKATTVTLPAVLLLLDYWPLNRFSGERVPKLLAEKAPLIVMSAAVSAATLSSAVAMGATTMIGHAPFTLRIANALVSYAQYLVKTVWPASLAILYPYPTSVRWPSVVAATILLVTITAVVIRRRQSQPYLAMGWFWFLGVMVPMAGFVQAGSQSMADRFTYLPHMGLLWALVWLIADRKIKPRLLAASATVLIALLGWRSYAYAAQFKDSATIFAEALAVTRKNPVASLHVADGLAEQRRWAESVPHYESALADLKHHYPGFYNAGRALYEIGRLEDAAKSLAESARLKPDYAMAWYSLGLTLLRLGREQEAATALEKAVAGADALPNADAAGAHGAYGVLLGKQGRLPESVEQFQKALRRNPLSADQHNNLGIALASLGRREEALFHFSESVRLNPNNASARQNLELHRQKVRNP